MYFVGVLFLLEYLVQLYDIILDNWIKTVDTEDCKILSIDEDSTEDNKKIGKEVCQRNGIAYMDREERGMQNNIVTACNYFEPLGIKWLIWVQHDCFPLNEKFFNKFSALQSGVWFLNILQD